MVPGRRRGASRRLVVVLLAVTARRARALSQAAAAEMGRRRFLLARHGESEWNREGRIQGTLRSPPLSPAGLEQAHMLGAFLAEHEDIRAVWCSPALRAQRTLQSIQDACAAAGIALPPPRTRDDLSEINLYGWQGRLKSDVQAQEPEGWRQWCDDPAVYRTPNGEAPLPELFERARGNWRALLATEPVDTTLVVAHHGLNRCMLATAVGAGMTAYRDDRFQFENCAVFEVVFTEHNTLASAWRKLYPPPTTCS